MVLPLCAAQDAGLEALCSGMHFFLFGMQNGIFGPHLVTTHRVSHPSDWCVTLCHVQPELMESTFLLHAATGAPHYLELGRHMQAQLSEGNRRECGFAGVGDVSTGVHPHGPSRVWGSSPALSGMSLLPFGSDMALECHCSHLAVTWQ
jgi:Glycosyl hydrolase family 47